MSLTTECVEIAGTMKQIYDAHLTTASGGNISIRRGNAVWITPKGTDKGVLTPEQVCSLSCIFAEQSYFSNKLVLTFMFIKKLQSFFFSLLLLLLLLLLLVVMMMMMMIYLIKMLINKYQ